MKKPILVIDSNCLASIARFSMAKAGLDSTGTGIIFGFMKSLLFLANQFETNKFIFAWDSRESHRREFYPEYKSHRSSKDMDAIKQFHIIREKVLPKLGFKNNFIRPGFEADDIIAEAVNNRGAERMIVVTEDNDLLQLLDRCVIYFPRKKFVMTKKEFREIHGVNPDQWNMLKAITGCKSDDVAGIDSIGEKTAAKFINKELKREKAIDKISANVNLIARNLILVSLPYELEKMKKLRMNKNEVFKKRNFVDVCTQWNLPSLIKSKDRWFDSFKMI